jgi:polysaccharide biosynthesis protein PelA
MMVGGKLLLWLKHTRRGALGLLGLGIASSTALLQPATHRGRPIEVGVRWAACYGANIDEQLLADYAIVILDPAFGGSVRDIAASGVLPFGYVSLGEIARSSQLFHVLRDPAVLLGENPVWPGTSYVDVRNPAWSALIMKEAIPALLNRGFSGIFLDTLDTPPHLEQIKPDLYAGMTGAAIDLVRSIRQTFPSTPIIMNRGYAILSRVLDDIDAVVAESLITTYDFGTNSYRWVEPRNTAAQLEMLQAARAGGRQIPVLSLDYWDPQDTETVRAIYAKERALGHAPYVSTILLDRLIQEPAS